jgi:predicted PurR-regulated permease PerM
MPLPSDPKIIFLGGLFVFSLLAAAYAAQDIILPIVAAFVLKLLLQPAVRFLERWGVPRTLAALLVIVIVFGTIVGLGTAISGPAATWAAKLPEGVPRLQERLSFLKAPIDTLRQFLAQAEAYTAWGHRPRLPPVKAPHSPRRFSPVPAALQPGSLRWCCCCSSFSSQATPSSAGS